MHHYGDCDGAWGFSHECMNVKNRLNYSEVFRSISNRWKFKSKLSGSKFPKTCKFHDGTIPLEPFGKLFNPDAGSPGAKRPFGKKFLLKNMKNASKSL